LGRSGLEVGRLALGAWGLQNPGAPEPARIDDEPGISAVLGLALASGMNLVDSAEVYDNEPLLGRLVAELPAGTRDLVVSTKFGHGKGFGADQISESVERSLAAWGIDSIPLFMLHDPRTPEQMAEIAAPGGALERLRRLQDEGVVGAIGIATGTLEPLRIAVETGEWDVIQFPRLYTLLNRAALTTGLLEAAKAKDIGTILTSPFTGNILGTGVKGVEKPQYSFFPAIPEVVEAAGRIEDRADALGLSLATAALAYPLQQELIDVIVFGVTSLGQLEQDIAALDAAVTPEQLEELAEAGAIDPALIGGPSFTLPFPAERREAILAAR
jgi:D-threo-aldose 1-dehydrogenase